MKLNELDAGGETPPDIISDVDDIQQGFDVDKFTEMIGHTLAEKRHIINAKEVMQEISSGYQELIDDEIYDVCRWFGCSCIPILKEERISKVNI